MKGLHWLLMVAVAWRLRQGVAPPVPGMCEHRCGEVDVPFPFGLDTNCARSPDFLLKCTNIEGSGIQLQWGNLTIHKISVGNSTMIASLPEAYECYDQNGTPANQNSSLAIDLSPNPWYRFSETQNKLVVVGCNAFASVTDGEGMVRSGCVSYCSGNGDFANETTCSGQGCCQASIPKGLKTLDISISSFGQNVLKSQRGRCARAFMVDNRPFNISNLTLQTFQDVGNNSGLVLDWMVESDVSCVMAKRNRSSYACGKNTNCTDFENGPGYRCLYEPGYYGNPYNPFEGCKDIDECKEPKRYPCHGKCKNTLGSYKCQCRLGKRGKGKERCKVSPLAIAIPGNSMYIPSTHLQLSHPWVGLGLFSFFLFARSFYSNYYSNLQILVDLDLGKSCSL
ncbi:wall-associated receptor kinase 2 isoform X1 [Eucalyptus grandis]|uniref:wall-associated receptor kinase 2 isoform X1 n=1 Tax=Eucalyptus grandis TaxID=71139 RepID=UPI00192F0C04|nr:wall-associated receptor kinase 2 isoform X1 [Eucalyptus grandis]